MMTRPVTTMSDQQSAIDADASARKRALEPDRSFIVQAPAGSGKTELLTQRYLRLLATVEHPEQVLAITFTRKAAAEMRQRILKALQSADEPQPVEAHKRQTWDLARAARDVDSKYGWHLLQHASRLRIQTIDALNSMLARRLPILAGTGSALEPTNDPQPLYEQACERLLDRIGETSAESAGLEQLIIHLGHRVDRFVALMTDLLKKRDQWLHPIVRARSSTDLRGSLESALRRVVERHLRELCAMTTAEQRAELQSLAAHAATQLLDDPKVADARKQFLRFCISESEPGIDADDLTHWQSIAGAFFKATGDLYQKVTKTQGFPTTHAAEKTRMEQMLASLALDGPLTDKLVTLRHLPPPAYSDAQWQILEALLLVLPTAVAELQLVFQMSGEADYVEGALRALQALGTAEEPTDLALAFDYRLRHILVDEFQDTSFGQLDLLERLTAGWVPGDGRTLFCVGDPMQSIYRFRQAEVGLFIELQRRGLRTVPLEPLALRANFRSVSPVVDWLNRVFPRVLASHDDPEAGAVRYSASASSKADAEGGVHIHATVEGDAASEARQATQIVKARSKQTSRRRSLSWLRHAAMWD